MEGGDLRVNHKWKVGIIGLGVVGGAIHKYFTERLPLERLVGFDLYREIGSYEDCLETNFLYLALPTKYNEGLKTYNLTEIEKTLTKLSTSQYQGLIILKSTVLPGTTEKFANQFPTLKMVHHPEFLKARSAYEDYKNQTQLVYGLPSCLGEESASLNEIPVKDTIVTLNKVLHPKSDVIFTDTETGEFMKLLSNSYYATQVQFFNEVYFLSEKVGVKYQNAIALLKRLNLHQIDCTRVPGPDGQFSYGGMCLPKDTSALLGMMKSYSTPSHQLQATVRERDSMRKDDVNIEVNLSQNETVAMYDPKREYRQHKLEYLEAISNVLESGRYIGGDQINDLEQLLSQYVGVYDTIAVSSGTDALLISLLALGVQAGDEVITVAFSWLSTATMIKLIGAVPVFVDIDPGDFNLDPRKIEEKVTSKTKGIILVSLFGQIGQIDIINLIAKEKGLWVIEDGAQSFGATYQGKKSGGLTTIGTTSFFPTKPLGCFGDGGAVFTNDPNLAGKIRAIRDHGQVERPYAKYLGINGRLDTIQAAVLLVKLRSFDEQIVKRQENADFYQEHLEPLQTKGLLKLPKVKSECTSVWAQYTILLKDRTTREKVLQNAKDADVGLGVFYTVPINRQECFYELSVDLTKSTLPVTDNYADRVVSLPIYPELTKTELDRVVNLLQTSLN